MKTFILYILLLSGLYSCSTSQPEAEPVCGRTAVELRISAEGADSGTRTTDEESVADVNLYLFGKDNSTSLHLYSASARLSFECPPGRYDVYVLVNLHEDLGVLTQPQTAALTVEAPSSYSTLPMSAKTEITVSATLTSPEIVVKRLVAKIACRVAVATSDIRLQSVHACNLPCRTMPFGESAATSAADCTVLPLCPSPASDGCAGDFYLFENLQGSNDAIGDQQQKSAENAPAYASYLLIRATRGEQVLTYRVYLGENNTDNFDVRRNTFHTLNITIRGDSEVDTRVGSYTVSVRDDLDAGSCNGYCIAGLPGHLYVDVESRGQSPALTCTVEVAAGDAGALSVGGRNCRGEVYSVNRSGATSYPLDYAPAVFNSQNDRLRYTVAVRAEYGFCQEFEFTHTFANVLRVNVLGGGSVAVSSALYTADIAGTAGDKLVLGNSCTLQARAASGFRFSGWYSDAACSTVVATTTLHSHTAGSRAQTLYAKFIMAEHMPLDADGTSNCYIAPKTLARYSFDATVMGHGDRSTNIQPKTLYGTTAKVIWQTGVHSEYESVVQYAFYDSGRIYFSTGSKRGNALIGLFDKHDNCIWSWHIWAVDYDPAASAETYGSGVKFMDRNLGVLSKSQTDRGLYYQWGRKDPFIYAETPNTPQTAAATCNLDGYPFEVRGTAGDYLPGSDYTLGWATAHPTTLLVRPFKGTGYLDSWLYAPNPNLWGNATGGSFASTKSKKSVYDPCPPGWRVPDRAAWDAATFKDCNFGLTYGVDMTYGSNTKVWTFYPYAGCLSGESGVWQYKALASEVYVWTNEPYLDSNNDSGYCLHIAGGKVNLSEQLGQHFGCAVRCIKE